MPAGASPPIKSGQGEWMLFGDRQPVHVDVHRRTAATAGRPVRWCTGVPARAQKAAFSAESD